MSLPALPSQRDRSASLTALAMGEIAYALDLIAACFGTTHQTRSDGSCRCGQLTTTKIQKGS